MGLLYTDVKHTFVKSIRQKVTSINFTILAESFSELEHKGQVVLQEEGFGKETITHQRFIDARYLGQGFELLISVSEINLLDKNCPKRLLEKFAEKHKAIYGYVMDNEEVEIVNIRITSLGLIQKPTLSKIAVGSKQPLKGTQVETREVYFEESNGFVATPVYDRDKLLAKNEISGPAIIEQYDTTTVIPKGWLAIIDQFGHMKLIRK
ncbi:MAG: hypothetical protein ACTSSH_12220 [Candidatus Heimdallarchaeota archaeon]